MSQSGSKSKSSETGKGKMADINSSSKKPEAGQEDQRPSNDDGPGGSVLADVNDDSKDKPSQD